MLDVDLIIRVMLNTASAVFFLMAYKRIRFTGFIILAAQVALNLCARVGILSGYLSGSEPLYSWLLIISNVVNLIAAYYLYRSADGLGEKNG